MESEHPSTAYAMHVARSAHAVTGLLRFGED